MDKLTEYRIKQAANVVDVLTDHGIELFRKGRELVGLCPFHDDVHTGNFKVNETKNICKCFSCGAGGDAIETLMRLDGISYGEALKVLAGRYGIPTGDDMRPVVPKAKFIPRPPQDPRKMIYWQKDVLRQVIGHLEENNLAKWMRSLKWNENERARLEKAMFNYCLGTLTEGAQCGWTVFPYVDEFYHVRTMKYMAYKQDGHRDKSCNPKWWHTGRFDEKQNRVEICLFGLHLSSMFKHAKVCIVESEKTAILCSALYPQSEWIWLATGGKSQLKVNMFKQFLDAKRHVILFPDRDGFDEWSSVANACKSRYLKVSRSILDNWQESDGEKADIADILFRMVAEGHDALPKETEGQKACRLLGVDPMPEVDDLIEKLSLKVE